MRSLGTTCLLMTWLVVAGCSDDDDSDADTPNQGSGNTSSGGKGSGGNASGGKSMNPAEAGSEAVEGGGSPGGHGGSAAEEALDPDAAPAVEVDRFSAEAATLMLRTADNGLPEANEPIDFDSGAPFVTTGLGPDGEVVVYYNFDVQSTTPAPIYALFREGEDEPVAGQLNILDVLPGDAGYNDFWAVSRVTVPADYVANTVTSVSEIFDSGFDIEELDLLVNCPVVPEGSTASMRFNANESPELTRGWYRDQVVYYFNFSEAMLAPAAGEVPTSPIYVTFNVNAGEPDGGPASGFVVESGTDQTHNVVATLPADPGYSPLWSVRIYDNADFAMVMDLPTASQATLLEPNGPNVNCPIVSVE